MAVYAVAIMTTLLLSVLYTLETVGLPGRYWFFCRLSFRKAYSLLLCAQTYKKTCWPCLEGIIWLLITLIKQCSLNKERIKLQQGIRPYSAWRLLQDSYFSRYLMEVQISSYAHIILSWSWQNGSHGSCRFLDLLLYTLFFKVGQIPNKNETPLLQRSLMHDY